MIHYLTVALFAMTAGFTASGITANLYRLLAEKPQSSAGKTIYIAVMVIAGPSVLFENAAKSFRSKDCSGFAFWLAAAVAGYWSFVLGLFTLDIVLAL
jgi:hypothetical protein